MTLKCSAWHLLGFWSTLHYQKYSMILSYLYGLLAVTNISCLFPVSSPRCKNRNIKVFGHCLILTLPMYLHIESRHCSGAVELKMEIKYIRDKSEKNKWPDEETICTRKRERERETPSGKPWRGWDRAHQRNRRIARRGRGKRQINGALLIFWVSKVDYSTSLRGWRQAKVPEPFNLQSQCKQVHNKCIWA